MSHAETTSADAPTAANAAAGAAQAATASTASDAARSQAANRATAALAPPTPAERLLASRQALQGWIQHTYHPEDESAPRRSTAADERDPGWLGVLVDSITDVPMATVAVRWVKRWWAHHPWRATAEFAEVAAEELIGPVARKHPWLAVGGAFVVGIAASRLRPWRWVTKDAVLASLLPTVSVASILHWVTNSLHGLQQGAPGSQAGPSVNSDPAAAMDSSAMDAALQAQSALHPVSIDEATRQRASQSPSDPRSALDNSSDLLSNSGSPKSSSESLQRAPDGSLTSPQAALH